MNVPWEPRMVIGRNDFGRRLKLELEDEIPQDNKNRSKL